MPSKRQSKVVAPRNPKLVKRNQHEDKQCPSAFFSEMMLTTQERLDKTYEMRVPEIVELLDMSEMTHQKTTTINIEQPLFQPFPSEIMFQNFDAHQIYRIPLQLRNNDQVARLVKVVQADSPYFKIISPPDVGHKVAPGMESTFMIQFMPDQKKDYNHEIVCITEREKFLVPVKAIGGRGILDFPDDVHFGVCPVKYVSSKLLLVRNIGNEVAQFQLLTEKPFTVCPAKGILEVGKNMQVEVSFCAQETGSCTSHLIIQYETGEEIYVGLQGDAVDGNIRLDRNNIKMETTYIGSASRKSVTISNRSDIIVNFSWKSHATSFEEERQKVFLCQQEEASNREERDEFLEECMVDPTMRDQYALLKRSLKNNVKVISDGAMLYNDDCLVIEPLEGEIWPQTSIEINLTFKPDEEKTFSRTAYLDITGRETRLPLKLRGDGTGPKVDFSFDTLDVENVFVNSKHAYEIVLKNTGDIDAVFSYNPSQTLFGQQFVFTPTSGIVKVGEYQAIQILFSSPHLGKFIETFQWSVEGSKQTFNFNVRGNVIGPTFHFDTKHLKFGTVSFGFTYNKIFKLVNTSLIPMSYHLIVPTDGKSEQLASDVCSKFLQGITPINTNNNDGRIVEFEIEPSSGTLDPSTELEVEIRFTPLTFGKYETVIVIDLDGVGENILALPLFAKSVVPAIQLSCDVLEFSRCFIQHKYEEMIELVNETNLPAKYELIPQGTKGNKMLDNESQKWRNVEQCNEHGEEIGLFYESPMPRGVIEPNSVLQVPLHVIIASVQAIECMAQFQIFGSAQRSLAFTITAVGEGPVVHANTPCVQFNSIPVLTEATETVVLSNESLIPAQFYCQMTRSNSYFRVRPESGVISPESIIKLEVTANVNDNLRFQEKLRVNVINGQVITVNLSAQGDGTTIVAEPFFGPVWDLGPQLSSRLFQQKIRFVNKGRRVHQIYWMTEGFAASKFRKKQAYNPEDMKYKNMPPPPEPCKPVFKLIPDRLSLAPGQHQDVLFQAYSEQPRAVKERMICQAIIGSNSGKERIMAVDIHASFIQPLLEFSEKNLNFTVVKNYETELEVELRQLVVRNVSLLPLDCQFHVQYPFSIIDNGNEVNDHEVTLEVENEIALAIQFEPRFQEDSNIRGVTSKLEVTYKNHPSTDEVLLTGDVYYPNLQFEIENVDFNCVLNDTEHVQTVKVTNISPLDVSYTWSFVHHDISFEGKDIDEGIGHDISDCSSDEEKASQSHHPTLNQHQEIGHDGQKALSLSGSAMIRSFSTEPCIIISQPAPSQRPKTSPIHSELFTINRPSTAPSGRMIFPENSKKYGAITWSDIKAPALNVGIEEVFDILPLYGCLRPSECQQFQFTFYGHPHVIAEATAMCSVKGGPDYEVQMKGQASLMQYEFSKKHIDFGKQLLNEVNVIEIELVNRGKVSCDFLALNVDTSEQVNPCAVNVLPGKGFVKGGEKVVLTVRYIAGLPERFYKEFYIRVGHFEPELLSVKGEGVFQRITLSLPRDEEIPKYKTLSDEAYTNLLNSGIAKQDIMDWDIQAEMDCLEVEGYCQQLLQSGHHSYGTKKKQKMKLSLLDYVLDFGHVVIDSVASQTCQLTNVGHFNLSLMADHKPLSDTGFYVDLDRLRDLPGEPEKEFINFQIIFHPSSKNHRLGPVDAILPIKIADGPTTNICLKAYVTMPEITVSMDLIDFGDVICGQCKVVTVQLRNTTRVRCDWKYELPEEKSQLDKHVPMHLRKKMKANKKPKPRTFEIMPPSGCLMPGQKINIQIKFMPTEETSYLEKLFIKIAQSTQNLFITSKGKGLEPHIEFEKTLLQFGPILPHTGNDDVVVKVLNPNPFPVEFYSLEYDKQYLEEEKVLRSITGYDEQNTILLPPRTPGAQLPKQILEHYENQIKQKTTASTTGQIQPINSDESSLDPIRLSTTDLSAESASDNLTAKQSENKDICVGDLEITPVSAAIASYLGIDLSVEGKAARNRRGICIIVHGAPLSGKTSTATELSIKYETALISIDEVVEQAIQYGRSSAAQRARELCSVASRLAKANNDVQQQSSTESKLEEQTAAQLRNQQSQIQGPRKPSVQTSIRGGRQQGQVQSSHVTSPTCGAAPSFVSKKLNISCLLNEGDSTVSEEEYYTCVLPDDVLVELLSDRMQVSDCHQGVVIDGLDSSFVSSISSAATILLRAINNRKYIYAVTLKLDIDMLKDMNAKAEREREKQKELEEKAEWQRLEEMSEDEYDSLTDAERASIDQKRLTVKRERMRKKREKKEEEERERKEKELLEEKRIEDERGNKKGRKSTVGGNSSVAGGKMKEKKSLDKLASIRESGANKANSDQQQLGGVMRPDTSLMSERSGSTDDIEKKQKGGKNVRQKSGLLKERQITPINESEVGEESEEDKQMKSRFLPFHQTLRDIYLIFDTWDRTTGNIIDPETEREREADNEISVQPSVSIAKRGDKKKIEKEKLKEITESPVPSLSSNEHMEGVDDAEKFKDGIGIPNIILETKEPQQSMYEEAMKSGFLPNFDEVMDGIGVGPAGPPIPPEAIFSVVPYPVEREAPKIMDCGHRYVFISTGDVDPNATRDDKSKSDISEVEKPVAEKKESKKQRNRQLSASNKKGRHSSLATTKSESPPLPTSNLGGVASPDKESGDGTLQNRSSLELYKHRWIIPPSDSVEIKISFLSEHLGQFDQTLNFEIVGTRRRYQLFCRGMCAFPSISREPRIVFPNRKKYKKPDEIVHKKFLLNSEVFEFGPLLAGKNRERYREARYPENMEKICICNSSPMHADVTFSYLNDSNATTFLLEPSAMSLKPGESQMLSIWAYPKTPGHYEDTLVCCIKENPEPILFKLSTDGVRPELELDRKNVTFDRVLLHRKETRTVYLRNSTLLPVAWKLSGMENLGDDFSATVDHGVIEPMREFALQLHFRAIKPVNLKKIVRLEVSDCDNVIGLAHAENIAVQAEAYDVALDLSFPKGADGGLDFGVNRVGDETKQTCTLKNKGKYEIGFHFYFETTENAPDRLRELFTVVPTKGTLIQNDRPTQIQVNFKSKFEFEIKDLPILKCQIIEPTMGEHGEIIASIPIRISARSVYSKYTIYPVHDINFGSVLVNTKKSRTLVIENKGDFDFRYTISKTAMVIQHPPMPGKLKTNFNPGVARTNSRQGSLYSGRSQQIQPQRSRRDSIKTGDVVGITQPNQTGHGNIKLTLGMFTIFPANGIVLPGSSTTVTVDMLCEIAMTGEEEFVIDISERAPRDHPMGIEYRLLGEACLPSIFALPNGVATVFEEQRIVKNLNVFRYHSQDLLPGSGVYGEDENRFIFYNVIVGHKAKARFQISNPNKVPCDVLINVKPISNKPLHKITDIFEVEPARAAIPAHSCVFATVTFQPSSMQSYSCYFEALVEGLSASLARGRNLSFEIVGDGNLPRINVLKPMTTNKKGCPVMLFHRLLLGRSQILPVVLKNDASLPCKMEAKLIDPNQSFVVRRKEAVLNSPNDLENIDLEALYTSSSRPVSKTFHVAVGETVNFLVEFSPKSAVKMAAELRLSVFNNPFEDNVIQLIGEGFQECVTIDNIHSTEATSTQIEEIIQFEGDEVIVPSSNQLKFRDCMIDVPKILNFTLTNHSAAETYRYSWNDMPHLLFSPSCGHLLPGCAKDITVTYQSAETHSYDYVNVPCKLEAIILMKKENVKKAKCWDNSRRTVQWVDVVTEPLEQPLVEVEEDNASINSNGLTKSKIVPKKRVVQVEPEPMHTVIAGPSLELDLVVSSNCNHAKYQCSTDRIFFKDTFVFQTRLYSFTMKNTSDVRLNYAWYVQPGTYILPEIIDDGEAKQTATMKSKQTRKTIPGNAKPLSSTSKQSGGKSSKLEGGVAAGVAKTAKNRQNALETRGSDGRSSQYSDNLTSVGMAHSIDGRPASVMTSAYEAACLPVDVQGTDDLPFTIEPRKGCIEVEQEATFTVRFSPLEVDKFNSILRCQIDNLSPQSERPIIALYGESLLPWCHFELEDSNYIKERRNPELKGPNGAPAGSPLDPNTKVVEFLCCGLNSAVQKKFFIVNPTNSAYTFHWVQESIDGTASGLNANMTCVTSRGTIMAGKKHEVVFEYKAETFELTETFWRFSIDNHNVSVPFVFVASGTEPKVSLDRSHVNFKELLLGYTARETFSIMNDEETPFHFTIDESSRHAAGYVASLDLSPMKGVLPPHSKFPVSVVFKPSTEAEVNFNVVCRIKNKITPLTVNVKARGFQVNMEVVCEDSQGQKVKLTQSGNNIINFGNVEMNEKSVRQIFISNTGNFGIDYTWILTGPSKPKDHKDAWNEKLPPVIITPDTGNIASCCKRRCQLSFCPPCKLTLKNCQLTLKVVNGPSYHVSIAGYGVAPAVDFSFTSHDFGACFLYRAGLPVQKKMLTIVNNDVRDVSIELIYTNTSHLEVLSTPSVLLPNESREVEFKFYPRALGRYCEKVGFELNGLSVTYVTIIGQGTEMKVEVADPKDRKVNLGVLQINEKVKRSVKVVNNSLSAIDFNLTITPCTLALQNTNVLNVAPNSLISLKPKASCDVIVQFHPRSRIPKFSEEIILECSGVSQTLFNIQGACQGLEIKLDSEAIPFGSVTLGSSSTRKLMMMNSGDIGASFTWNLEAFKPVFSISPHKGYISPGMEVAFEITFLPHQVNQDIRYDELRCSIENGTPLKLVLTGSCIPQIPMKEVIHFNTHVRNRDTKTVTIHNKTNQLWPLRPVIDGEFWGGADTFVVEPQQSKNYELLYRPLTMTQDNKKHNGSVFFALPDGSGLLYNLLGNADPPKPVGNVQRDVPCKMNYTEVLVVNNWLRKPQRFRVIIELLKPEKPDPATTFKGLDYIDVPGLAKKEYKIHFYAHREGAFSSKVTFKNEQTGEFQFYYVSVKVGSPGTIGTIELSTPVRQSISHVVTVNNPLLSMVNFQTNCNIQDVNLPPQLTIPPQSEGSCTFEYLPLKAGSLTGKLTLQSVDLGVYIYDLNLTATPAAPERAVHFVTTLGSSHVQACKFTSYARTRVEYTSKVDSSEFMVERSVNAASAASGGSEVNVDVTFEPSRLGESQATLVVSSNTGGEYVFPVYGHCLPPKPQGPYTIKAGGSTQIPFKNIFAQTTSFTFHIDNPAFSVKATETVRAKKTHNIVVSFDGNQGDTKAVRMGRLLVTCARSAGHVGNLVWTFYLKGITL